MSAAILIPLKVFGFGFVISMCISFFINLLLNAIKLFTKNASQTQK